MKIEAYPEAALGAALAARVALDLRAALEAKGHASLAVPGGSTPGPFLSALAKESLDWGNVTVTLTDERQVSPDNPRSNARLVAEHLMQGRAQAATFVPLYRPDQDIADVERALNESVLPLDVCVLGMGDDMHTASLFPGTPGLSALLNAENEHVVASVTPPGADEPRITLTARALKPLHMYLLIKGQSKREALDRALQTDSATDAPIRAILDGVMEPVVFYAD